ncbi:glutathione S-transferase N-terminal domain-containing protein [Oceanibacterium hippocampi]|uniref:GST N-terminal domain-containing protein n=1 Tax=Oceanibacterium hippocampi TaxID=745714 RepID=A0A1Y5TWZ2_9PROT|nr:glutathione S-transferase family protein [Oceanibacterium hippocampi]SLN75527.1 hypothetical protein OCH7691_03882 [Oceanibacterium hippocampi]
MHADRYRLYGVLGSPYAAKVRALLRYRHLPFDWIGAGYDWAPDYVEVRDELRDVKPPVIPVLRFPHDGSYRTDSTVLAYQLEDLHPGHRSVIPDGAARAFLSHLLEDMADEWGMKMAFWYRWSNEADGEFRSRFIMAEIMGGGVPDQLLGEAAKQFRERQVHRMDLVGVTPENGPLVIETYDRVLDITNRMNERQSFLFGSRPSLADFGWYGALFTCWNDPSPGRIMTERAPGTIYWLQRLDEASGVSGDWYDPEDPLPESVVELLGMVGDVYLPFLAANAAALDEGRKTFTFSAYGRPYTQGVFRYQRKCLEWLRSEFAGLSADDRASIEEVLKDTGCLNYLV